MRNRISGLAALVVFLLFPTAIDTFVGGFMSGFSMPLLCASVLLILRKWWWGFLPLMVLQIQAYPMVAVQTGMMLVVDTLLNDRHQLWKVTWWKGKVLPFTLAAVACGGLLLGKYSGEHPQFGHLVDRTEIGDRGEFTSDGRAYLIPARPLHRYIRREWVNPFHIAVLLLSYLLLGGRIFRLPRGPSAMLLSGFLLYWLADIFMLRLYFPSRYLYRTLPLFAALTAGFWVSLIVSHHGGIKTLISTRHFRVRWSWARVVLSSFVLIGVWEFGDRLDPEYRDLPRYDKSGLYGALRELPGRPLIAAHPALASELPTLTGKSVFISEELSHPWWTEHWKLVSEHTQDFFRGYYSRDPDVLRQIIARHEIDYWVIRRRHFRRSYIRGRDFSIAPFNRWIVTALRPTTGSLLNLIPKRYLLFEDSSFALVSSANVLDWLEQRQVRVPRSAGFGGRRE